MTTTDTALLTSYAEALVAYRTAYASLSACNSGHSDDLTYFARVFDVANASEALRCAAADADICERQHAADTEAARKA